MRELHLFAGSGGGLLASKLLENKIIGAVEYNEYCCKALRQRQKDGFLDEFPIFHTDVREFIRGGYAKIYKGYADVVVAGFPCQPFSVAGQRNAEDDERNMWPATLEIIKQVQPKICFLENVPGLLSAGKSTVGDGTDRPICGYFGTILRDLSEAGYGRIKYIVLGADDVNGKHRRKRLWIRAERGGVRMANTNSE